MITFSVRRGAEIYNSYCRRELRDYPKLPRSVTLRDMSYVAWSRGISVQFCVFVECVFFQQGFVIPVITVWYISVSVGTLRASDHPLSATQSDEPRQEQYNLFRRATYGYGVGGSTFHAFEYSETGFLVLWLESRRDAR